MIPPTARGALFSARATPQPSQNLVEPWWNPGGTLVEPSWNLTSGPLTTPEPIWARPQSFFSWGKNVTPSSLASRDVIASSGSTPNHQPSAQHNGGRFLEVLDGHADIHLAEASRCMLSMPSIFQDRRSNHQPLVAVDAPAKSRTFWGG